jgi:hypothetical protein
LSPLDISIFTLLALIYDIDKSNKFKEVGMPISPTQQKIIEKMEEEPSQNITDKDVATSLSLKRDSTRAQLGKLEKLGIVKHNTEAPEDGFWLTDDYQEAMDRANRPESLTDAKLTPKDYFRDLLSRFGVKEQHVPVIADTVWTGDPENLTWVWNELGKLQVAPDTKKQVWEAWRAYNEQDVPPELEAVIARTKSKEELALEAKQRSAEPKEDKALERGWLLEEGGPEWYGTAAGQFTLAEAKEIYALRQLGLRKKTGASADENNKQGHQDSVSSILTALQPYIAKDTNTDLLREAITKQMELQEQKMLQLIPPQGEKKGIADNVHEIMGIFTALQSAGPLLRGILGIPEQVASAPANANPPAMIQLQNADGTPITLTLPTFFELEKFKADQRREEESHKNKQEMMKTTKDFLVTIGTAAHRMSQR